MFSHNEPDDTSAQQLSEQVAHAYANKTPLRITAGNSKLFYGNAVRGEELSLANNTGIIEYRPSELVLTAKVAPNYQISKKSYQKIIRCWLLNRLHIQVQQHLAAVLHVVSLGLAEPLPELPGILYWAPQSLTAKVSY